MKHKTFKLDKVSHRPARFADAVQEELTKFVLKEIKDERLYGVRFLTFTHVEVSDDLRNGRVLFSLMTVEQDPKRIQEIEDALNENAKAIRYELMKRMRTKNTPLLQFKYDAGLDYAQKLEPLFQEIKKLHNEVKDEDE
jgi:ribosome-binding factor A